MPDEEVAAAHRAKFKQVAENLMTLARELCAQHPEFPRADFAQALMVVGIALMDSAIGTSSTVEYLARLRADLESRGLASLEAQGRA